MHAYYVQPICNHELKGLVNQWPMIIRSSPNVRFDFKSKQTIMFKVNNIHDVLIRTPSCTLIGSIRPLCLDMKMRMMTRNDRESMICIVQYFAHRPWRLAISQIKSSPIWTGHRNNTAISIITNRKKTISVISAIIRKNSEAAQTQI